ncbi:MAG: hypothetical protein ACRD9S_08830 [Pyrinomonadaceae bacterium]
MFKNINWGQACDFAIPTTQYVLGLACDFAIQQITSYTTWW